MPVQYAVRAATVQLRSATPVLSGINATCSIAPGAAAGCNCTYHPRVHGREPSASWAVSVARVQRSVILLAVLGNTISSVASGTQTLRRPLSSDRTKAISVSVHGTPSETTSLIDPSAPSCTRYPVTSIQTMSLRRASWEASRRAPKGKGHKRHTLRLTAVSPGSWVG